MEVSDLQGVMFDATVTETRSALTSRSLLAAMARYPLVTLTTVVAIHWQALKLWRKRVAFVRKPMPPPNGLGDTADRDGTVSEPDRTATPADTAMEHAS